MFREKNIFPILVFAIAACACGKSGRTQRITLHVSEAHIRLFTDLEKNEYTSIEAESVLQNMAEKGDRYCLGLRESNRPSNIPECRDWYSKTEIGTDDDFIKVNTNSDRKSRHGFDCYSIGFIQPYIMAANLKCARLNIVDADYRVIKAHLDFLNLAQTKPGADVQALLNKIRPGAPGKRNLNKKHLALADLCGKSSETKCLHYLITFLEKFSKITEINLILTPLHEFSFLADRPRLESVFYTGNAFDPHLISESEFESFLRSLKKSSHDAERLIIYHQEAERSFGIYKVGKYGQISTICADRYPYKTYFDKKSLNYHNGDQCSEKI